MDLIVAPAQESDIDSLMEVQFSAFEGDPYHEALYPGDHYSPENRKSAGERTIKQWHADPTLQLLKCTVRESGLLIGYAHWHVYKEERPEAEWKKDITVDWTTGRRKEIAEAFLGTTLGMRRKTWQGRPHLCTYLIESPVFHAGSAGGPQRLPSSGSRTLLVQWGLTRSEQLNLPAYLEATPVGYHLYLKMGFHQIDTMIVKAEQYDGDVDKRFVVMVKDLPNTSKLSVEGDLTGAA